MSNLMWMDQALCATPVALRLPKDDASVLEAR